MNGYSAFILILFLVIIFFIAVAFEKLESIDDSEAEVKRRHDIEEAFIKGQIKALNNNFYVTKKDGKYFLLKTIWEDGSKTSYDLSKEEIDG